MAETNTIMQADVARVRMIDFNLQDHLDKKMLSRLQKDWYRYRQKCDDGYPIPIFF